MINTDKDPVVKRLCRILIIKSDVFDHITKAAMRSSNFGEGITITEDAADALDYLCEKARSQDNLPEILLLDLKMKCRNIYSFLQDFERVCGNVRHCIAVGIVTEQHNVEDILRLRNLGNYFLVRGPITLEDLVDIHCRYFKEKEG